MQKSTSWRNRKAKTKPSTNHIFPKKSSSERRPFKQIIFNEKSDRFKLMYYSQIKIKDKYP